VSEIIVKMTRRQAETILEAAGRGEDEWEDDHDSGTRRFTAARRRDLQDARLAIRAALDGER
jgi:hypothetical protein